MRDYGISEDFYYINYFNMISIPQLNDSDLIKIIKLIKLEAEPIMVNVKPEEYSIVNECFPNVKKKIERDGGRQIIGWQVWKTKIMIEAEFHAVWESQDGNLIDITPKQIPMSMITFLPDAQRNYEGQQVNNIRLNITDNLIVDDFIGMAKVEFDFLNKGDRKFQHKVALNESEQQEYNIIRICKDNLELMVFRDQSRRSVCFCGSGNFYEDCCYQIVKEFIRE